MGSVRTPCVGEFSIMTRSRRRPVLLSLMVALLLVLHSDVAKPASAVLVPFKYLGVCPQLEQTVRDAVSAAHDNDPRIYASLLRLFFHDCFVHGCDASILLKDPSGEQNAFANLNSARGFGVIDAIKAKVESICPQTVSCADILALAARDSVSLAGGTPWIVPLGRYDSLTASQADANTFIPAPFSDFATLLTNFQNVGLSEFDLVALSGAHTFGRAHCSTVNTQGNSRLYNYKGTGSPDPNMNTTFLKEVQAKCPKAGSDSVLNNLDVSTPDRFDNAYYQNLLLKEGFLNSDQVLVYQSDSSKKKVQLYASNQIIWFFDFAISMIRMGNLSPKDSTNGEIRLQCGSPNPHP